jgi:DNA-binding NtrC family response regulator
MSKTAFKLKILYGELDTDVLTQQAASIQKAGHQVEQAVGRKAVQEALKKGSFDLVILGATLSKDDRHHLPYMVKKAHTGTRVLVMHTGGRHPEVDATIDAGRSIEALLETIARVLSEEAVVAR